MSHKSHVRVWSIHSTSNPGSRKIRNNSPLYSHRWAGRSPACSARARNWRPEKLEEVDVHGVRDGCVDIRHSTSKAVWITHAMGGLEEAPPAPVGLGIGDLNLNEFHN